MFGLSHVNTCIFTLLIKLDSITFFGVNIKVLDILVSRRDVHSKIAWFNDTNCDSKMPHFNAEWIRKGFYTILGYAIGCDTWGGEWETLPEELTILRTHPLVLLSSGKNALMIDTIPQTLTFINNSLHFFHSLPFNWSSGYAIPALFTTAHKPEVI